VFFLLGTFMLGCFAGILTFPYLIEGVWRPWKRQRKRRREEDLKATAIKEGEEWREKNKEVLDDLYTNVMPSALVPLGHGFTPHIVKKGNRFLFSWENRQSPKLREESVFKNSYCNQDKKCCKCGTRA